MKKIYDKNGWKTIRELEKKDIDEKRKIKKMLYDQQMRLKNIQRNRPKIKA